MVELNSTKDKVVEVFDSLASKKAWESLYTGTTDRLSYNFVTRQRAVEKLLDGHVKGNVIDLGCGTGDLVPFFTAKGVQYTGLDLSEKMIERAKLNFVKNGNSNRVRFMIGDCENLPFKDGEFDTLSSVALIEYLPQADNVLKEVARVLKPGGYALITVPHKSGINFKIRDVLAPLRKLFYPLYMKLKGGALSVMKDVKHYHYDPAELDGLMEQRGFEKCAATFTNFYVVPHPLDHVVPKVYMWLSERVDQSSMNERLRLLAANYIALYRKR